MEVCKPAKTFTWQIPWCRCVPDGSRPHLRQGDASVRHRSGSHDLMRSESCRLQSTRCFGTSRGLQDHPLDQRVSLVQPRPNSIQHGLLISQHSTEQRAILASPAGTRTKRSRPRGAAADFAGPRWTPATYAVFRGRSARAKSSSLRCTIYCGTHQGGPAGLGVLSTSDQRSIVDPDTTASQVVRSYREGSRTSTMTKMPGVISHSEN